MTRSAALDVLLEGLVDYAGLFPPAALPMPDAVARYAQYQAGPDRRMLGRIVVPASRLAECAAAVAGLGDRAPRADAPWRLSVLAGVADADALGAFNTAQAGRLVVDTIEAKADDVATIRALARTLGGVYTVYVELPVRPDPAALISAVQGAGLRAKLRTGGVTADAFPTPEEVLRFLGACVAARVAFKATAGLHHPLRGEYPLTYAPDSARATMYGFLGVFLAAVLLVQGAPAHALAALLDERDATALVVERDALTWRGYRATSAQVAAARATFAGSFGSCSFEEPVLDLTTLRLT